MNDQPLFSLTKMTGQKAADQRMSVVGPAEVPTRMLTIGATAFIAAAPLTALFAVMFGMGALLFPVPVVAAAVWLFHGRSRRGLEQRRYVELLDRRRAVLNQFMLGTAVVDVPRRDWSVMVRGGQLNPARRTLPKDLPLAPLSTAAQVVSLFDQK